MIPQMKKLISARLASNVLLIAMAMLMVFHVLVLIGVVPAAAIWGGQVEAGTGGLIVMEVIAMGVTLVFATIIAAGTGYLKAGRLRIVVKIGVWLIFAFLLLNTLGNLASGVAADGLIFSPITLILAFFAFRLAIE